MTLKENFSVRNFFVVVTSHNCMTHLILSFSRQTWIQKGFFGFQNNQVYFQSTQT